MTDIAINIMRQESSLGADVSDLHFDALSIGDAHSLFKKLAVPPKLDLAENIRAASKAGSRDFTRRIAKAMWGPGKLTLHEFFYFRLYDPALDTESLNRFVGKLVQFRLHAACNDGRWYATCNDKLLWSTILDGARLAVPETLAVFSTSGRFGTSRPLPDAESLRRFVMDPVNHPLFCKPIDGTYSIGAIRIEGAADNRLIINDGQQRSVDDVVRFIASLSPAGYLLQRALKPAPALAPVTGVTIACIRFLVLLTNKGPVIESAVLKLPTHNQVADNYWRSGNMLAAIDLGTGTIKRVVSGTGSNLKVMDQDPRSGLSLVDLKLPDFEAAKRLCLEATPHFAGIRTQSWDVALTADGPVLLEINFGGDFNLHQLAHNRGILSDAFCRHLKACGFKRTLPTSVQ